MDFIKCNNLTYNYIKSDDDNVKITALKNISFTIKKGEFVAVIGHNGSGKSTLSKIFNALLIPPENTVFVDGMDVSDNNNIWKIRKKVGMIFQNPDNQLISSVVEDDVAFGCENLAIPSDKIRKRVDYALEKVGLTEYKNSIVSELSGGQKQKVAIAGILAMKPECIVFDESTAMLDPVGRKSVLDIANELNSEGITIIFITHYMEEVLNADRIMVLNDGEIVIEGTPLDIFSEYNRLRKFKLDIPQVTDLGIRLGIKNVYKPLQLAEKLNIANSIDSSEYSINSIAEKYSDEKETILKLENINYVYPNGKKALNNISAEIKKGELVCIIGQTGSGKSTLIQLLNGIYKPTKGSIYFKNQNIKNYKNISQKIGIVFQYPEDQIFETTVFEETAFAPKNMKLKDDEINKRVKTALDFVNIGSDKYDKSPFELSGGEKRRLAIAGILAMEPEILVLDEPMAGLDPVGRKEILKNLKSLTDKNITVILVSHSMEETAEIADRIMVLNNGELKYFDTAKNVFKNKDLYNMGLSVPKVTEVFNIINKEKNVLPVAYNVEDAERIIKKALGI